MPTFIFPDSDSQPISELREAWTPEARQAAAAARKKRGAGEPILAKQLGRGTQPGDKSLRQKSYRIPRKTTSLHYRNALHRLDAKYSKHDILNQKTGEITNAKVSAHFQRFMKKVRRTAWKDTLSARRASR